MANRVWVLRIKPGLVDQVPAALASDQLIIGWGAIPQLLDPMWGLGDFRAALSDMYYPGAATMQRAGSAAGNLWRFLREMTVGDVVLVPHRRCFYVAVVTGHPTLDPDDPVDEVFRRAVQWLNEKQPFLRDDQPDVYKALLERKTCYEVNLSQRTYVSLFVERLIEETSLEADLAQINRRSDLSETTRKLLIDARVGQGRYRTELLARWGNTCAVSGCAVLRAVRASHAVPWSRSTDQERLDSENGLPLLANLDALFDAGLIAFDANGEMLVSSLIPTSSYGMLGIPAPLRQILSPSQASYLRRHRELKYLL